MLFTSPVSGLGAVAPLVYMHLQPATWRHRNLRPAQTMKLVALVDSVTDEIYSTQALNALLVIHVMDSSSNSRGADETEANVEEVGVFLFSRPVAETLTGGAGGLGGSVSMATSQLGNHCKSKREGDIKGMNDEKRKGGQREMRDGR